MQATHDPTDLLPAIVEGMLETPPWTTFLEGLRRKVAASYASLIFRPLDQPLNAAVHLYAGEPAPPMVHQLYHDEFHRYDPLPYDRLVEGRPYATAELLRADDPAHRAFFEEVVRPSGMAEMRIMRVQEASGVNAWLTVARGETPFSGRDDALLATLAPVLRSTLRNFIALERERFGASIAGEAMRRLRFGWFTLDASGRVLEADPQGARTLSGSTFLRRTADGRLSVRPPALAREVFDAIRNITSDPRPRPRAVTLSRDPWLDMLLVPMGGDAVPTRPRPVPVQVEAPEPDKKAPSSISWSASDGEAGIPFRLTRSSPAVIAYVHGDRWRSIDRCEQLGQLFGLSPSEARLALALSRGMSIAEAAEEMGVTVGTARVYSKKIYAKTGARGQPDLIRFVMRSVLAIA